MPLSNDEIKALLAKPQRTRGPRTGGKTSGGKTINTDIRDYQTWFKLGHGIFERGVPESGYATCSNPDCQDDRDAKSVVLAEVNGVKMCRKCFLSGYMLIPQSQEQLNIDA